MGNIIINNSVIYFYNNGAIILHINRGNREMVILQMDEYIKARQGKLRKEILWVDRYRKERLLKRIKHYRMILERYGERTEGVVRIKVNNKVSDVGIDFLIGWKGDIDID